MAFPEIYPLSETAICIAWGNTIDPMINRKVLGLDRVLQHDPFPGFVETVPAYATLTIYYQPGSVVMENGSPFQAVKKHIEALLPKIKVDNIEDDPPLMIPVCYDDGFGHDLEFVASANNLSKEEVIHIHQQKEYLIYMMGFLPGFAYMGEVDNAIATPRKQTPRAKIEEGAVGIAGKQTGIYPLASPGGWQIIGRTPICLFNLLNKDPFLLKAGNRVRFYPIAKNEFDRIKDRQATPVTAESPYTATDVVIIKTGFFSAIQDSGRTGFQSYGVPISGALDNLAYNVANALVGNPKGAAVIECTMGGLTMQFKKAVLIAVTGAGTAFLNHQKINTYQTMALDNDDLLEIRYNNDGIRTYIAVSGGFAAPEIMNSRSTCARAGIGGALRKDDILQIGDQMNTVTKKLPAGFPVPPYSTHATIRIIKGPETGWMNPESLQQLYQQSFTLTNQCDRMGYQLQGGALLLDHDRELVSTAVTKGSVQLTPGGQLILLMGDCQTTGGYPRIAQIAAVDLPIVAQLKPGDNIQFTDISFREAEELYLKQQKEIDALFS